jgi:hypothetical protein
MKASVRGMLCVVAIVALALPAAAEMTKTGQVSVVNIAAPTQSTLYDQMANPSGNLSSTQDFESAYDTYDAEGADDFEVTWADGWNVEQVAVVAGYWSGTGPAAGVHVTIYDDAAGMPGSAVCTYPSNAYVDDGNSLFTMTFGTPCYLPMGTYWVNAQGQLDYSAGGQYGWGTETVQTGAEGVWRNPGGGFGNGCTAWTARSGCAYTDPDYSFRILGENAPPGDTPTPPPGGGGGEPIPTMNAYGIFAMIALLFGIAVLVIIRRR